MTRYEIITAHRAELLETIENEFTDVIKCAGRIQTTVYIWEDGEIETLTDAQGSNTWLQPKDAEPRALYRVCFIEAPLWDWTTCVDPGEYSRAAHAEDPEQALEDLEVEAIEWYISEYAHSTAEDLLE